MNPYKTLRSFLRNKNKKRLINIFMMLLRISIFKYFFSFQKLMRQVRIKEESKKKISAEEVKLILHLTDVVAKRIKIESCLIKSITKFLLTSEAKEDISLNIGVKYEQKIFKSHAWITSKGLKIDEPNNNFKLIKTYRNKS